MTHRGDIKSVKKACLALTLVNQCGDVTVSDIARALGIARPTAYRVIETLASLGYVEKQPHSDYYRQTSRVTQLASGFQGESRALEIAKPMIYEVGKHIGWSVSLLTPRGADMIIRITTNHDTPTALDRYRVGLAVPILHSTAGFCHLAHCAAAEAEAILAAARASGDPLQSLAHNPARLAAVLRKVRAKGFSNLEFMAYREGNIGVPLLIGGKSFGGLVMRYIKSAMTPDKLLRIFIPQMIKLARDIELECAKPSAGPYAGLDAGVRPPTRELLPSDTAKERDLSKKRAVARAGSAFHQSPV
jgi:IclR family mhp operon transcriptional activator